MEPGDETYAQWQAGGAGEEAANFGGPYAPPPQDILGIAAGAAEMESLGDVSYEIFAADADNINADHALSVVDYSFQTDGSGLPCHSSFNSSKYDPNLVSASSTICNTPPQVPRGAGYGYTYTDHQSHGFYGALEAQSTYWAAVQPGYETSNGTQSLTAAARAREASSYRLGTYDWDDWVDSDYHTTPTGPNPAPPFPRDDVLSQSFSGYSPQPASSTGEMLASPINPQYLVSLSRQPSQDMPTVMVSPPRLPRMASSTAEASQFPTAAQILAQTQTGLFYSSGQCPLRDYVNNGTVGPWNTVASTFHTHSSPSISGNRTRYAPSETDSTRTGYTSHTGSQPRRLGVLTGALRRRLSEPSPVHESASCTPKALYRSLSSQSSNPASGGGRRAARRDPPRLHPKPQQDGAAEPRPAGVGVGVGPGSSSISAAPLPRTKRGRRRGQLSYDDRVAANKVRNDRSMCIGCKIAKVKCEIPEGAERCLKCSLGSPHNDKRPFVCTQAYFIDRSQEASTNSTSQYSINHFLRDGLTRHRIKLPRSIDIADLLNRIEALRGRYRIRVAQVDGHYDLDLDACYTYVKCHCAPRRHPFRRFINDLRIHRKDNWKACVRDGPETLLRDQHLYERLLSWNETPSRATYSLVLKSPGLFSSREEKRLDPDSAEDLPTLLAAAQLARIVGRKLELAAYDQLQRVLAVNTPATESLLWDLGRIAMSLRRRVARWRRRVGTGRAASHSRRLPQQQSIRAGVGVSNSDNNQDDDDDDDDDAITRVTGLCQNLYVYWLFIQRQAAPHANQADLKSLTVRYPGSRRAVEESFPRLESLDGFCQWMEEGLLKLREAGVA